MIKKLTIAVIAWFIVSPTIISVAGTSPAVDMEKALRALLTDNRFEYLITLSPIQTVLPEKYDSLRVEMLGESQPFGNCWFKAFFYVDGIIAQTVSMNAQVQWYTEALVSTRAIQRAEAITTDMVTVMRREVTSLNDPMITTIDETDGKEATRTIPQGKTLTYSMVRPEEVIKRGDQVTIMFNNGNLQITAVGEARQAGARGESIKVKNLSTNRIITAEVQDEQLVKVNR